MSYLSKETFVCIDCEFTGLDAEQDRIIEIAAVVFTFDEVLDSFETLIDPECHIPDSSIEIHHITQDMVTGKPKMQDILPNLLKMIGRHILVGHGIGFDVEMIVRAAERASVPCKIRQNQLLDTLRLARLYGESPVNSLEHLRQHFNIEQEGAHRAMSDVIVNVDVFKFLTKNYKTVEQVMALLSKPILLKIMPLGKHKGRALREIPLDYLIRAAKRDYDQDLLFTLRHEIKRRKQGNNFFQANNPFSDL
jgi:DNA polymerase III subunit epsilon